MRKATAFASLITLFLLSAALAYAEAQVGVKSGDWIKCELTGGTPPEGLPKWVKVECLSVTGTTATIEATIHVSEGTEQNEIMTIDVASGNGSAMFQALIPANSKAGDTIKIVGYGDLKIAGETTGTYAGASRTVVYASLMQNDTQFSYRWDKQTGIVVEITLTQGLTSATFKATSTNIWQTSSPNPLTLPSLPIEILSISISVVVAIVIVTTAVISTKHKRS